MTHKEINLTLEAHMLLKEHTSLFIGPLRQNFTLLLARNILRVNLEQLRVA